MTDQHVQHGFLEGCAPSAQVSPDMTVAIAAGSVLNANVSASVAAQNATITAAHATQDRWDLISVSNTGTVTVTAGTPADVPVQPDDTDVPLAHVYVYSQANASYTGTIVAGVIQDARGFVLIHASPYKVSNNWYPSRGSGGASSIFALNDMALQPLFVAKDLVVKTIGVALKTVYSATAVVRLGIYADDGAGGVTLLVDAGTVSVSTGAASMRTISISQTLTPGWWWLAAAQQVTQAGGGGLYRYDSLPDSPIGISDPIAGTTTGYMVSGVSGALPSAPAVIPSTTANVGVWVQAT